MLHRTKFLLLLSVIISVQSFAIDYSFDETLSWTSIQKIDLPNGGMSSRLSFIGANFMDTESYPYFASQYNIHTDRAIIKTYLKNAVWTDLSQEEADLLNPQKDIFQIEPEISVSILNGRGQPQASISFVPIRINPDNGKLQKLLKFTVLLDVDDVSQYTTTKQFADKSVLASGDWIKIRIDKGGVYKLSYSQLQEMGFDVGADPRKIAVYGNGGGILPEANSDFCYDDLVENAIKVVGADDGSFDAGDYILFYGDNPVKWEYDYARQMFIHENNYYDDYTYYFITVKKTADAKRIENYTADAGETVEEVTTFNDYSYHEIDELNLAGTGRTWFGEVFDFNLDQDFSFDFPNVVKSNSGKAYIALASRAYSSNQFLISINDQLLKTQSMPISLNNGYEYGRERNAEFDFTPKSDNLILNLYYQRASNSSAGYLNYIELNVDRYLEFAGSQMSFRKVFDWATNGNAKYILGGMPGELTIWDVTSVVNPENVVSQVSGGKNVFISTIDTLRQFIAFDGSKFYTPEFVENVSNQNLHAVKNIDYLIIAYPDFRAQAERLAAFHRQHSGLEVFVTDPQTIYNEFSSGSQDISGIRNFVKMLYDVSDAGKKIKYLLLFGDASYDYKDRLADNTNFVPCWEHTKSLNIISSVASDDYYGYLDDLEGDASENNLVDIGIGRFVVANEDEAKMAVDKTIDYCTNAEINMGPWRNQITFLADDEDSNHHMHDAEKLSSYLNEVYPEYITDKIYVDAYPQISTPSGQRAPDVNQAIATKIDKGTLIFNYSGHGGELGLGHERFMEISDINSWTNYNRLPIFITATCEFSRYDDPTRISAGELVFLNQNGGAIALFTTARATFASSNLALNKAIYENNLFEKVDGEYPRFGDVIRRSKKLGNDNDKKFVLLGDPAIRLAYPEYEAVTEKINSHFVVEGSFDTLNALSNVKVDGYVADDNNNKLSDFNGIIYPTVYDKKVEIETLGTDDGSYPETFSMWKSVLFNGKVEINNGDFSFEFIMPRDISYNYGPGRISYYFNDALNDGNGHYDNIIIGGFDEKAAEDTQGPDISLYFNDTGFTEGGTTDENPVLLAYVEDESGINTTGNGIGHDILAVIDDESTKTFILNDYYEAEVNRYNSGIIKYPFFKLEDGEHELRLRVWDIYNNSSVATLKFLVVSSQDLVIDELMNYPNPANDYTYFTFTHNQSNKEMDVKIEVFDMSGRLVKTLTGISKSKNYKAEPMRWDCHTDAGGDISRGFYMYKLTATNEDGQTKQKTAKLIYVK